MTDKYQVLIGTDKNCAVIERTENPSGKELWNIYVPNAGDQNVARRLCRLLNIEHDADAVRRASRITENTDD